MAKEAEFDITQPLSSADIAQLDEVIKMSDDAIPTIKQAIDAGLPVESQLEQVEAARDQAQRLKQAFQPKRTRSRTKAR